MRILFVDPPFHRFMKFHRVYYPLGLAYMAGVLRRLGHEVLIYDAEHCDGLETLSWKQAAQRYADYSHSLTEEGHRVWQEASNVIQGFKPDVVGITMLSVKSKSAAMIARLCKQLNPATVVAVGADHPTVLPDLVLRDPNIDYVVRGEGEATIAELVQLLSRGDKAVNGEIDGLSFRGGGSVVHGKARKPLNDLDLLPYPDLDALHDYGSYRPVDLAVILGSRGCSYGCTFCGVSTVWGRKMRFRAPSNIVREIQYLFDRTGATYFSFRDATFTLNRSWALGVCREIVANHLPITWECVTRADFIDRALLFSLKNAGCTTIRLGVESGSAELLSKMNKMVPLQRVRESCSLLNEYGFYWSAYVLFGTPWETKESIQETLQFITELDPPFVTMARYTPLPGSHMYRDLEKARKISPDIDWSQEGNQRFRSNYLLYMDPDEFEKSMVEIADFADAHNASKSIELCAHDGRLK